MKKNTSHALVRIIVIAAMLVLVVAAAIQCANGKSLAMGAPDGLVKLIFDKVSGCLVGAHIMGVQAADLAQQCADMMSAGVTRDKMLDIIFGHPTVSEVLMSAARNVK